MEIDSQRLRDWLSATFGVALQVSPLHRLSGGAVQDNWSLDVEFASGEYAGKQAFVLRCDAASSVAASLSRSEEFAALKAMYLAGVVVPEPIALCEDESVLGRCFYLMRRVAGEANAQRLVRDNGLDGEHLARQLGAALARVHTVRAPFPGLENFQQPDLAPALYRIQTYRHYLDAIGQQRPALEWALRWLERFAPTDDRVVFCHGDFRTGNYLVAEGQLTAILDWEFASFSHPDEDLGWFCASCWRFGREDREAGGIGSRAGFYQGYEAVSATNVEQQSVAYWEVMATVRWAVIALQQGQRHLSGQQRSLELALTARMVPELEYSALNQIERIIGVLQ